MFSHPEFDQHEELVFAADREAGLRAIVAIHSTALGPAFGGCRMWPYLHEAEALADVLRLSRGMTYKAAICDLPLGGGKSVIMGGAGRPRHRRCCGAMGRVVESLGGRYVIADDIGTTLDDLATMRAVTEHTAAASAAARQPIAVTAHGVLQAIGAAALHRFGSDDLAGLRVAVQGLGNVGLPLACQLHEAGSELVVCDLDPARVSQAERTLGARGVAPEAIYDQSVDLFAPCALGGVLNDDTIGRLRAQIVCGGANNQLAASPPCRGVGRTGHPLCPRLSGQCRWCHRLPPGADRRSPSGGAARGRPHPPDHPRPARRCRRQRSDPAGRGRRLGPPTARRRRRQTGRGLMTGGCRLRRRCRPDGQWKHLVAAAVALRDL